ncbi:hypothetical protein PR048_004237 [Dryococelus australis]|uniref:NADH dehydrogenase [ubiquinone] 1 alpha subcomplex subunit 7 n=1 Tax=Dryococelus australis TaxID=614101 RepID=A0ABQ9I4Y1_9NEOP|nr:hypothetical protein PR048_004237 [Dryococelus australis]
MPTGRRVFLKFSRFSPLLHFDAAPYSPRFTLIGSQDLDVKSHPRENPLTDGIVRHDYYLRKTGDPAGDRARFALVGGERANRSATVAPGGPSQEKIVEMPAREEEGLRR